MNNVEIPGGWQKSEIFGRLSLTEGTKAAPPKQVSCCLCERGGGPRTGSHGLGLKLRFVSTTSLKLPCLELLHQPDRSLGRRLLSPCPSLCSTLLLPSVVARLRSLARPKLSKQTRKAACVRNPSQCCSRCAARSGSCRPPPNPFWLQFAG